MKVFLTGATGTIGGSILNALSSSGYEVTCAVRSIAKAQALAGPNVVLLELDQSLDLQTQFYNAAKGFSSIIHSGFAMSPNDDALETQVITGLINAAKESAANTQTTLIFTTGALCQGQTDHLAGEDEATNANCIDFVKFRIPHEEMVINANSENLHASVIRPVCIYGGSFVDQYYKACKTLGKILVPHGNNRVSYIHKEDLGEFYKVILENSPTGFFTASEGLGPNVDEVIEIAKAVTGVQEVERVDNVWEHMQTYGFYLFELSLNSVLDGKRARELFGFQPKKNFKRDAVDLLRLT